MTAATSPRPAPPPAWDTAVPGRRGQSGLVSVGVLLVIPAVVLTVLRVVPPTDDAAVLVASFVPFAIPLLLLGLLTLGVALVRARRRGFLGALTGLVAVLLVAHVAWQLPFFVPYDRPVDPPTFGMLNLNAYKGLADPDQVRAAAERADLVVLVESTPALLKALDRRGWRERFPFAAGASADTVSNTVVFSRWPLSDSERFGVGANDQWATTVAVPDLGAVRLIAAHPCNPYCGQNRWAQQHADLFARVQRNRDLPLVVAGDFNAVADHGPMRALRRAGLRSAADLLGTGWAPTYPAGRLVPPLLTIDHVLVDHRLGATELERIPITGTDHLGLFARLGRAG